MKLKEFLSARAVEFDSVNILEDPEGVAELQRLGARSIPVLSRGDDWVFAQNLGQVVKFLGLNESTAPALSPAELIGRLDLFLSTAARIIPQMPNSQLATETPGRPRSYRVLSHHMFRVVETFLLVARGAELTHQLISQGPPEAMQDFAAIAAYGEGVRQDLLAWWAAQTDTAARAIVPTYYGPQVLHEYLERTTWHCGQHVRQWHMLLGMAGIAVNGPLTEAAFAQLPMPGDVWDG